MKIAWHRNLELYPSLRDIKKWPVYSTEIMSKKKRKKFLKKRNIVAYVLKGNSITDTAEKYSVSTSFVHYLLERTLGSPDENTYPALTKGLMPNVCINKGLKKEPLSEHDERGYRGSFTYLLMNVDGLEDYTETLLIEHIQRKPNSEILKPSKFHKYILNYLEFRNWPDFRYPLNTQSKGFETCRQYFHKRIRELKMSRSRPSAFIDTNPLKLRAYQEVEIDAQIMDVETTVYFLFKDREIPMRVSRITLYLVRDKATGCYLAYHISYTKHPNRYDVLKLLTKIHAKWIPLEIKTPGLSYSPGACMPSSLGEVYQSIGIGIFHLDNAMAHHANLISEYVTEKLNATLNLGVPGTPEARSIMENAFDVANDYVHRFQSTTGSHVKDPKKESSKNRKKLPAITMQALEEIVSVLITNENVTAKEFLGSMTPLEALKSDVKNYPLWIHFDSIYDNKNPFIETKEVNVKCIEHENRAPHVNFMRLRYKGNCLDHADLIGKKIIIEVDSRDIRQIIAYSPEGELLGKLNCPLSWQGYPCSITTKQHVDKLVKQKTINSHDPLRGYFSYLRENMHLPKIGLELYKLFHHAWAVCQDVNEPEFNDEVDEVSVPLNDCPPSYIPDWNPEMIFNPTNNYEK